MKLEDKEPSLSSWLQGMGITSESEIQYNLSVEALTQEALTNKEGLLDQQNTLICETGTFTGRSPKDKFIVKDEETKEDIWWGAINQPMSPEHFEYLYQDVIEHLKGKKLYVRDAYAVSEPEYQLTLRVINTKAWHNLFCHHLFLRPTEKELKSFEPTFTIINAPDFEATPSVHGTRQGNFAVINFTKKIILIGGTGYAGEMKKGIFTVLNYLLPKKENVLPMHCAANIGKEGDTTLFFGLSGTGKTTLSADPHRALIGDDEHGWSDKAIFNFEGGCYAKVVHLTKEKEPQIYACIKEGAILENVRFFPDTKQVNFDDTSITENTRAVYPAYHISNSVTPAKGPLPKNIFFLTCDAYGVLPPISRLNKEQAMYHFMAGYTAKVAGTEAGIVTPQVYFSSCFGDAFLPLHPSRYATMLGERIDQYKVHVWLVNTGWIGGPYGIGKRISLSHTRTIISAAINGQLDELEYRVHPRFNLEIPTTCPNVPNDILDPKTSWEDQASYEAHADKLAGAFENNFEKFKAFTSPEILTGGPEQC